MSAKDPSGLSGRTSRAVTASENKRPDRLPLYHCRHVKMTHTMARNGARHVESVSWALCARHGACTQRTRAQTRWDG